MKEIKIKFGKKQNEHEIAILVEDNSFLDYVFIYDNLQIIQMHENTKKRFLKLNDKFLNITTIEYINNVIVNMAHTF